MPTPHDAVRNEESASADGSAANDAAPPREEVLRELLDDAHRQLRELGKSLQRLKDFLG
jgi:hypothetical protein